MKAFLSSFLNSSKWPVRPVLLGHDPPRKAGELTTPEREGIGTRIPFQKSAFNLQRVLTEEQCTTVFKLPLVCQEKVWLSPPLVAPKKILSSSSSKSEITLILHVLPQNVFFATHMVLLYFIHLTLELGRHRFVLRRLPLKEMKSA